MAAFEFFVDWLVDMGVVDVLLPFLLIFAIIFAIMIKAKILGDPKDKRNIHIVVSLVIALIVVIPHVIGSYPPNADPIDIMNRALPSVSLVLVAIVALLLLMGVFGVEAGENISGAVGLFAVITVVYIFGAAAGWWANWNWITLTFGEDAISIAIVILVFAVLIWWITKSEQTTGGEKFLERIGKWFKKHE